jgi:pyruvate/2-oxoglutarate/acetoin dehydrogenase E1 component
MTATHTRTAKPAASSDRKTTYREAMREALREALRTDERVFLMGEDVGRYGGCFGVSLGLLEEFGPERIRDAPLSESAFVGAGIGAALAGMRPIVEIMTVNFSLLALDQILNSLYNVSGDLPADAGPVDIDHAAVRRPGTDVSLITYGGSLPKALAAADDLANDGISAEVVDLRTLRPLDDTTIGDSVARTHRAVVIDEGWRTGSLAAEISARLTEQHFYDLDAPVERVCSAEVPMPYARRLEEAALPQVGGIVAAARRAVGGPMPTGSDAAERQAVTGRAG